MGMRFTPPPAIQAGAQMSGAQPAPSALVWRPATSRLRRRAVDLALTLLAIGGVASLATAAGGALSGVTPLVLRSGSMSPAMPVGTLALARTVATEDVAVGDVVSVVRDDGTRVTHRVVSSSRLGGTERELILRGDANTVPDPDAVRSPSVDRVIAAVPAVGGLLVAVSRPPFQFIGGVLTGIALLAAFGSPQLQLLGRWQEVGPDHFGGADPLPVAP
jgi:signal peptidase I